MARYRALDGRHLIEHRAGVEAAGTAWLSFRSRMHRACRTDLRAAAGGRGRGGHGHRRHADVRPAGQAGRSAVVVKTAALFTSLDRPLAAPVRRGIECAGHARDFASLLASHRAS
ncbi:hypothetical protein ACFV2Q_04270 [Streptomyces sp. NPDC059650]|uniref:hypothetical protein n=1 Tax=Streptomyces sp. NPDC059650 TaxID=3346896 RepID=UPI003683A8ED